MKLNLFFKPRLSRRMARQLAKNLILRLDIEELVEHPESVKSAEIRAKYLAEIERRNENDLSAKIKRSKLPTN